MLCCVQRFGQCFPRRLGGCVFARVVNLGYQKHHSGAVPTLGFASSYVCVGEGIIIISASLNLVHLRLGAKLTTQTDSAAAAAAIHLLCIGCIYNTSRI